MASRRLSDLRALLVARGHLAADGGASGDAASPAHPLDPLITAVAYDSRTVTPGALFVALRGRRTDGHVHAAEAAARGAAAILCEGALPGLTLPQLRVDDGRAALALAAAWHAGYPSRDLGVVGITGTDGKTTTAYLVRAILQATAGACGLVGTTDVIIGGRSLGNVARSTTPEAPELQGHLAAMRAAGDRWAVVESTSHGLAQQRVAEVAYDVGVLTNVTSEHLEFHGTMEAYRSAKQELFRRLAVGPSNPDKGHGKHAVINADDPAADAFVKTARGAGATVLAYGLGGQPGGAAAAPAEVRAIEADVRVSGTRLRVATPRWSGRLDLPLPGRFNIPNALAALGVAVALGFDPARAAAAISEMPPVPGRMQRVDIGQPFGLVIDYAHTADALAKVLDELRPTSRGQLIAVFGSAGERDTQKRPAMGRVAGERCDLVVITDEDPRGEDRVAILEAIAAGAEAAGRRRGHDLLLIADRAEAITAAVARARPGDVVLLAGKGHERSIEMADGVQAWDEEAAARAALEAAGFMPGTAAREA